jgi:hypothetical protein
MLGDEQRVMGMVPSNQMASGTPMKLLMKHRPRYSKASVIPTFSECNIGRMLLVSMAARAKHRMRYVHMYSSSTPTLGQSIERQRIASRDYLLGQVREPVTYFGIDCRRGSEGDCTRPDGHTYISRSYAIVGLGALSVGIDHSCS